MSGSIGATAACSGAARPARVMSEADRAHWDQVQRWRARRLPENPETPVAPGWVDRTWSVVRVGVGLLPSIDLGSLTGSVVGVVGGIVGDVVGGAGDVLEAVGVVAVTERLGELGVTLGRTGLHAAGVVTTVRRAGHDVDALGDLAGLEVDDLLAARPRIGGTYVLAAAVQGGAAALVPGLGSVLGRHGVSPTSLAGLLGHVAGGGVDTVLTAATCTRVVTLVGAYYGYDPAGPDSHEHAIALAVLSVSLADGPSRHSADHLLRSLQAGHPAPPRLVREVTAHLGARLRHREIARATPLLGVGIAAVLAGRMVSRVLDDADHLYRERFLRERYDHEPMVIDAGDPVGSVA